MLIKNMNTLSALGRMTYSAHLLMYPVIGIPGYFGYKTWSDYSAKTA